MDRYSRSRRALDYGDMDKNLAKIHTYEYEGFKIRVINSDGEKWIIFADICKALGYKNPNHENKKIPEDEKRRFEIGLKNTLAIGINKRGLLSFALFSNKPTTSQFRKWANADIFGKDEYDAEEILHSILLLDPEKQKAVLAYMDKLIGREVKL